MSGRVFRALMKLLPAEFRGDYEREMEATFRAERRQAEGAIGVLRLWASTITDLFRTAPAEHIDILRRDLRYSVRMLARRPALALTAIITLALGIGANTAIFSVVNGVLLAPLPYPNPDRLVLVQEDASDDDPGTTGYYSFDALRSQQATFDWLAAMGSWTATFTGDGKDPGTCRRLGRSSHRSHRKNSHRKHRVLFDLEKRARARQNGRAPGKASAIDTIRNAPSVVPVSSVASLSSWLHSGRDVAVEVRAHLLGIEIQERAARREVLHEHLADRPRHCGGHGWHRQHAQHGADERQALQQVTAAVSQAGRRDAADERPRIARARSASNC